MIFFVQSPAVSTIPVLVFLVCPILYAVISPNTEYRLISELEVFHDIVREVQLIMVGIPARYHVTLVVSDQMYFVVSNMPPVLRAVHEK